MSQYSGSITAPGATEEIVIEKCNYFATVGLWPLRQVLDPDRWLSNFEDDERELAVHLLNQFMYFSEHLVDAIFRAAFQILSRSSTRPGESFLASHKDWRTYVDSAIITYVTGEEPNPTDSGLTFARKARQILGIRVDQIMTPDDAINLLIHHGARPVIFVDDFVGTGNQFEATWTRQTTIDSETISFERLSQQCGFNFSYCPAFATELGIQTLRRTCPQVTLCAGNVIPSTYGATAEDSVIWPADKRTLGKEFIRRASERAGLPNTNGLATNDWQGFNRLGLTLALHNSVPDATLPIFYWKENGWRPLIPRT